MCLDLVLLGLVFIKINMLVMALQIQLILALHGGVATKKLTSVSRIVTIVTSIWENGVIILALAKASTLFANQHCKLPWNLRHCFYDCIFKTMKYCMLC